MESHGNDSCLISEEDVLAVQGSRLDGNLHFDQSIFNRQKKLEGVKNKKNPRSNSCMTDQSSNDSDLSDDAFLNRIHSEWGGEESELR